MNSSSSRLALLLSGLALVATIAYIPLSAGVWSQSTPAYASVRTDPQGTSLLFGAYARAGYAVERGWDDDSALALDPATTTAFVIAPSDWHPTLDGELADFVRRGGRLVIAAPPMPVAPSKLPTAVALDPPPPPGLDQSWGARRMELPKVPDTGTPALAAADAGALPPTVQAMPLLDPHVALRLGPDWTPLFAYQDHVYMATRAIGAGRVILASEAAFLSNDNLALGGDPALLAWLAADRPNVWVDETLHRLGRSRGIPWLLARYRLLPATLLLLLTLLLLAWSLGGHLQRRPDGDAAFADASVTLTEDSGEGYRRLLRRAIPVGELLPACARQLGPRAAAVAPLLAAPAPAARIVERFNQARQNLRTLGRT